MNLKYILQQNISKKWPHNFFEYYVHLADISVSDIFKLALF